MVNLTESTKEKNSQNLILNDEEHLLHHGRRLNNLLMSGGEDQAKIVAKSG